MEFRKRISVDAIESCDVVYDGGGGGGVLVSWRWFGVMLPLLTIFVSLAVFVNAAVAIAAVLFLLLL